MTRDGKTLTIKDIMRAPRTVHRGKDFRAVLEEMITQKTNSLVVVDENDQVMGIVNPKAIIKKVVPEYLETDALTAHFATEEMLAEEVKKAADTPLEEFMEEVQTVREDAPVMEAAVIAITHGNVRIPVVDAQDKVVGLITRTELKQVVGAMLGIEGVFDNS